MTDTAMMARAMLTTMETSPTDEPPKIARIKRDAAREAMSPTATAPTTKRTFCGRSVSLKAAAIRAADDVNGKAISLSGDRDAWDRRGQWSQQASLAQQSLRRYARTLSTATGKEKYVSG